MKSIIYILLAGILFAQTVFAQEKSTTESRTYARTFPELQDEEPEEVIEEPETTAKRRLSAARFIFPAFCIAYGTAARFRDSHIYQYDRYIADRIELNIDKHYPHDNYLAPVPAVLAMGLDFLPGIESEHNLGDRTLVMATSYIFMYGAVNLMKNYIPTLRPRGWGNDSFPSGHTAAAFTGAHLLYKEYRDESAWIGVGGYLIATATGALRILNRAHWMSDVVTGAGIGILSAEIGYMMLPVWHRIFGIDDGDGRRIAVVPMAGSSGAMVGMVYVF